MKGVLEVASSLYSAGWSLTTNIVSRLGRAVHIVNAEKNFMTMYRVAQVIISGAYLNEAIQSINGLTAPLNTKLVQSLRATGTHFAFEILAVPSRILPFSSKQVNVQKSFENFCTYLCDYYPAENRLNEDLCSRLPLEGEISQDQQGEQNKTQTAVTKQQAESLFESTMKDLNRYSYFSVSTFNSAFLKKIDDSLRASGIPKNDPLKTSTKSSPQVIQQKSTTLMSNLVNIVAYVVDIVGPVLSCLSFLQEHNLLDTGKIAAKLGQYRGFQWLPKQTINHWILGLYTLNFGLLAVNAVYNKFSVKLNGAEKNRNSNTLGYSVANFMNLGASLFNSVQKRHRFNSNTMNILAIMTHSFCLWSVYQARQIVDDSIQIANDKIFSDLQTESD